MFTILIVRMVSQVCTYINTYKIVYLEYLLFIVRQLHLNKAVQMVGFFLFFGFFWPSHAACEILVP